MDSSDLRTYRRRQTTRESGFHTIDGSTGGECKIIHAEKIEQPEDVVVFRFFRQTIDFVELFNKNIGILAFGGYLFSEQDIKIDFSATYTLGSEKFTYEKDYISPIMTGEWNNIGFHKEISLDYGESIDDILIEMKITGTKGNHLEFVCFDFNAITKSEFTDDTLETPFYQKTSMHIPYLYYLDTSLPFKRYLKDELTLEKGRRVILKSCNRCGRHLPINIDNEMNTLSFSLHCKKRAPCVHSTFRAYTIQNVPAPNTSDLDGLNIENGKVVSYYGHQLECKACKKFFVNAPLNPQRNPQQFKEDGLRRRAIEVLVNHLLKRNLVHFEFENKTKREFSEHIWKKFGERCFKCNKRIPLDEMHLDHTMPLAYLYRLDESASCLCSSHNSQKSDNFPVDYYSEDELVRLSKITGLSLEQLHYKGINIDVLNLLIENVVWYFDDFLSLPDYQKVRDGILTADKINDSLKRVIAKRVSLEDEYRKMTGHNPITVTTK
jgi:hypothetical protein